MPIIIKNKHISLTIGAEVKQQEPVPVVVPSGASVSLAGERTPRRLAQFGYMSNITVYRAVKVVAEAVASVDWRVVRKGQAEKEIEDHPLVTLLGKPNGDRAKGAFIEQLVSYWLVSGTAYQLASFPGVTQSDRPRRGAAPLGLYNLRPDRVTPKNDTSGYPVAYEYDTGPQKFVYPSWKVLPLRFFHPLDELSGVSPIAVAATIIERQNQGEEWNMALMQHMARPSGAFVAKGALADPTYERLKREVLKKYGQGKKTVGIPLILENGLEYIQLALSPVDADWIRSDSNAGRKIATAIGVDPLLLNDKEYSTYNNMKEAQLALWTFTALPLVFRIRDEWNNWLVKFYGEDIEVVPDLSMVETLKANRVEDTGVAISLWNAGLSSFNEGRKAAGLDEVDDGEFYKFGPNVFVDRKNIPDWIGIAHERRMAPPIIGAPLPGMQQPPQPRQLPQPTVTVTEEGKMARKFSLLQEAQAIESARKPYYDACQAEIAQHFREEQQALRWQLQTCSSVRMAEHVVRNVLTAGVEKYTDLMGGLYIQLVDEGARRIQAQFQSQKSVWGAYGVKQIADIAAQSVEATYIKTAEDIDKIIGKARSGDLSIQDVLGELDSLYEYYADTRSGLVSTTEITRATNYGAHMAAVATGLPLLKTWLTVGDDRVRESHRTVQGQRQPLVSPYELVQGYMQYPGDSSLGAPASEYINCRCSETYEIDFSGKASVMPPFLLVKYNPYHSRDTGRFVQRPGGVGGASTVAVARTIDEAITLLGRGQGIMFQRPEQAVTMIHKLYDIAKEARAKGEQAPTYDLCKVSVKHTNLFCEENVGIPRKNMPQLRGKPKPGTPADALPKDEKGEVDLGPAFREHMAKIGHPIEITTVDASRLRASQNELNGVKVASMMVSMEHGTFTANPIFVSRENYVIDGHHNWAASVGYELGSKSDVSMNVMRVDLPILYALREANSFADRMGIPQAGITSEMGMQQYPAKTAVGFGRASIHPAFRMPILVALPGYKFNPYHSQDTGRFIAHPGGGTYIVEEPLPGMAAPPGLPKTLVYRDEVEAYMRDQHPSIEWDFQGSEDANVRDICEVVHEELQRHPQIEDRMAYVGTDINVPGAIEADFIQKEGVGVTDFLGEHGGACTGGYDTPEGFKMYMIYNSKFTGNTRYWDELAAQAYERGIHRQVKEGVSEATYTAKHEAAHMLWNGMIDIYQEDMGPLPYRDGEYGTMRGIMYEWADSHVRRAMISSGYGATEFREAIAEGYSQYYYAQHPSRFGGDVVKFFNVVFPDGVAKPVVPKDIATIETVKEADKAYDIIKRSKKQLGVSE